MKILFVHALDLSERIGGAVRCHSLANALANEGVDVEMLAPVYSADWKSPEGAAYRLNGIRVSSGWRFCKLMIFEMKILFHILRKSFSGEKIGLIYTRRYNPNFAPLLASKLIGCPLYVEENGFSYRYHIHEASSSISRLKAAVMDSATFLVYRYCTKVVSVALGQQKYLEDTFGFEDSKSLLIPNSVDGVLFRPRDKYDSRKRIGIRDNALVACFVGHLYPARGVRYMIMALPSIVELFPDFTFIVVGKGPEEEALKALVIELGLEQYVRFFGFVEPQEVSHYIGASDFCVAPYDRTYAGSVSLSPLKIATYLACARPILLSDINIDMEDRDKKETCVLFEPENVADLAFKINEMIGDLARLERMSEAAIHRGNSYSWAESAKLLQGDLSTFERSE